MRETSNSNEYCDKACRFIPYYDQVEICQTCGLGRTLLAGRVPELQDYSQHDAEGHAFKKAHLLFVFKRYLHSAEPRSLLDIGCADGILIDIAASEGWRVTGVDSHSANSSPHVVTGRFLDHHFTARFDALTLIHSFEHMDDPRATLLKCRSLIEGQGRLLIVVPNFGGWWAQIMGADWQWLNADDHRYHFTEVALRRLLEQAGFRIEFVTTNSAYAPSLVEMFLSSRGVFDWPMFRWRPIRSLLYKASRHSGFIFNRVTDLLGNGAELQVLARPA